MDSLQTVLSMTGGLGDDSYSLNSYLQARSFQLVRDPFLEAIRKLPFPSFGRTLRAADLGCATGPNTISTAQIITNSFRSMFDEIWVFFCDLPSNDFNTLFQQLSVAVHDDPGTAHTSLMPNSDTVRPLFFAAAVAGSFYGPLFPPKTLHVASSSNSLHWLSRVPPSVERNSSPAWNKGRVWIRGAGVPSATVEAYAEQARLDLDAFLRCRADELMSGGLLFLLFPGRITVANTVGLEKDSLDYDLEMAWRQLIDEGIVGEGALGEFNIPWYFRSEEEVRRGVEGYGEYWRLERMEVLEDVVAMEEGKWKELSRYKEVWSELKAKWVRSLVGKLIEAKIGVEKTNELFQRFTCITATRTTPHNLMTVDYVMAILIRK